MNCLLMMDTETTYFVNAHGKLTTGKIRVGLQREEESAGNRIRIYMSSIRSLVFTPINAREPTER